MNMWVCCPRVGSIGARMDAMRSEVAQIDSQLVAAQSGLAGVNGQLAGTAATIVTPGVWRKRRKRAVAGAGRTRIGARARLDRQSSRCRRSQTPDRSA